MNRYEIGAIILFVTVVIGAAFWLVCGSGQPAHGRLESSPPNTWQTMAILIGTPIGCTLAITAAAWIAGRCFPNDETNEEKDR